MEEAPEEELIEDDRQKNEHYERDDNPYPTRSPKVLYYIRGAPIMACERAGSRCHFLDPAPLPQAVRSSSRGLVIALAGFQALAILEAYKIAKEGNQMRYSVAMSR